jgi:DNA repair protein RadC
MFRRKEFIMANLAEIFGRIIGDECVGVHVADYLAENPHAKVNDLVKFRGVGMQTAKTIMMVMEGSAEYLSGIRAVQVSNPSTVVNHLSWMRWEREENMAVVTLDGANHIIDKHLVSKGIADRVHVHPREILRHAILDNAVSIIIAHNHPSGNSEPSEDDIAVTRAMVAACHIMKIPCLDHIVISRSGFSSIRKMHPELFED